MKYFAVFVLSSLLIFTTSCNKDNDMNCDVLSENIVGVWEMSFDGSIVEFRSDGTFIDDNESLIGGEVNGTSLSEKTYSIEGMELNLRVEDPGSGQFLSTSLDVSDSECDKITLSFLGIPVTMNRQ